LRESSTMRLVTITQEFVEIFHFPTEIMSKDHDGRNRPFLLLLTLLYKGKERMFALPFRSNIQVNKNTRGTYFALPRRHTTKTGHAHGLHYTKIFPIMKGYYDRYHIPDTEYDHMVKGYIQRNIKTIINEAQQYLIAYENGVRYRYCTDIDRMIEALDAYEAAKQMIKKTAEQIAIGNESESRES